MSTTVKVGSWRLDPLILVALSAYIVITAVLFSPLLVNFGSSTLAPNISRPNILAESRDRYHFMWNFWWERTALSTGQNVLYTTMMFAPTGVSLALQTMDFVDGAIAAPVAVVAGNVAAYNFVILTSFVLSGFAAFLLGRHLTGSWTAGFGAGLIFAYFPQHLNQAYFGHPNFSSVEWLPAYLLALMLTYEKRRLRYGIVAGVLLATVTFTELEQLVIAIVITLIYLVYQIVRTHQHLLRNFITPIATVTLVWLVLTGAYLIQVYQTVASATRRPPSPSQILANAAKPIFYVTPPPASFPYGNLFSASYSNLSPYLNYPLPGGSAQWVIFVGYVALALAIIGVITSKDSRRFFFLILAGLAFVFSLGPSINPSQISIQTPYTILYNNFKILQFFRTDARFSILLMLCVACLAAYGINSLVKLARPAVGAANSKRAKIVGFAVLTMIVLEFAPVVTTQPIASDPVYNIIAADHSQFYVLLLPKSITVTDVGLYEQTLYKIPLVNGKISQSSTVFPDYMSYQLFLRVLSNPNPITTTLVSARRVDQQFSETQLAPLILTLYKIKYVILYYREIVNTAQFNTLSSVLYEGLGPPIYQDGNVIVFALLHWVDTNSVIQMAKAGPIVLFGSGWGVENALGFRDMNSSAQLMVYAATPGTYSIRMISSLGPVCVTNYGSGQPLSCGSYDLSTHAATNQVWLKSGENLLNLSMMHGRTTRVSYINVSEF